MTNRKAEGSPQNLADFFLEVCQGSATNYRTLAKAFPLFPEKRGIGIALICLPYPLCGRECIFLCKALEKSNMPLSSQRTDSKEGTLLNKYSAATMARVNVVHSGEMLCAWIG